MSRRTPALALLAVTSMTAAAHADVSEVATARQLAISGIDAVESGDCKKGEPLLERAEALHHASVHLQYLARCRASGGRLVAATEMWRQIIREGAPANASPAVLAALGEATTELDRALPRLASTTVRTAGDYRSLELRLDGVALPHEIVGTAQVLDPGAHELVARAPGFRDWSKQWTLTEGGTAQLVIELSPAPAATHPVGGAAGASTSEGGKTLLSPFGWVSASVGVAALVGGTVTLLARDTRRDELTNNCTKPGSNGALLCWSSGDDAPPGTHRYTAADLERDKQTVRDLTTASTILFIGGGALVAGGVTLILLGGGPHREQDRRVSLASGAATTPFGLTLHGAW